MSEQTLRICEQCGAWQAYLRPICHVCHGRVFHIAAEPLRGEIYSLSVIHRAGNPAMGDKVPYTVALVRGPTGGLVLCVLESFGQEPAIGDAVSLHLEDSHWIARPCT